MFTARVYGLNCLTFMPIRSDVVCGDRDMIVVNQFVHRLPSPLRLIRAGIVFALDGEATRRRFTLGKKNCVIHVKVVHPGDFETLVH